jgi:hypothetical protein
MVYIGLTPLSMVLLLVCIGLTPLSMVLLLEFKDGASTSNGICQQ